MLHVAGVVLDDGMVCWDVRPVGQVPDDRGARR